jgi:hypothetical protein
VCTALWLIVKDNAVAEIYSLVVTEAVLLGSSNFLTRIDPHRLNWNIDPIRKAINTLHPQAPLGTGTNGR